MICKNNDCKFELPDDAVFCLKCGTKQGVSDTASDIVIDEDSPSTGFTINKKKFPVFTVLIIVLSVTLLVCIILIITKQNVIPTKDSDVTASSALTTTSVAETNPIYNYKPLDSCPVVLEEIYTITPNSAGGIDLVIYWKTYSQREIKYIYLYATPYNRVGDIEASEIGGKTTTCCRMVGPYDAGDGGRAEFENVWYNYSISETKINQIEIEYMDGTKQFYCD